MKNCVNGQIIDMTPDEVTAYQEATITTQQQIPTAGLEDKMRVYIESIPTADTPTVPPKIGFKWKLTYRGIAGFAWELVPDPDAVGTVAKPFEWFAGIRVVKGYHYTNGVDVALAVANGIPATFDDERFLVKI
jgi:hypothetical protein